MSLQNISFLSSFPSVLMSFLSLDSLRVPTYPSIFLPSSFLSLSFYLAQLFSLTPVLLNSHYIFLISLFLLSLTGTLGHQSGQATKSQPGGQRTSPLVDVGDNNDHRNIETRQRQAQIARVVLTGFNDTFEGNGLLKSWPSSPSSPSCYQMFCGGRSGRRGKGEGGGEGGGGEVGRRGGRREREERGRGGAGGKMRPGKTSASSLLTPRSCRPAEANMGHSDGSDHRDVERFSTAGYLGS